jgi:hypothetical protein
MNHEPLIHSFSSFSFFFFFVFFFFFFFFFFRANSHEGSMEMRWDALAES